MSEGMNYEINDVRTSKDFTGISFSGYKKSEVKKQLTHSILNTRVEPANYWTGELICAGHFLDVWEIIIFISNKYIHYGNPKLPIYINLRFENFKEILINGYVDNEIEMRNHIKIRELFSEIISILVFSQKKHSFDVQKIQKTDFDLTEIKFRLKANTLQYSADVFRTDDPKELFIAINELAYSVSKTNKHKNSSDACFWIDWILEFDRISKSKKEGMTCETRAHIPVQAKFQKDIIWIIWDVFMNESKQSEPLILKIIQNLLSIYCIHYTNGVKRKRRYILYFVVSLLTEKVSTTIPLQMNPVITSQIKNKIHFIYREIKKNEIKPKTDYLFNGMGNQKTNLEKTIEKIDKMNSIGFIPRE